MNSTFNIPAPALPASVPPAPAGPVLLLGNPNVGKSALFGALTGTYVTVSNYPGTTVEVASGAVDLAGEAVELLDTPGTS